MKRAVKLRRPPKGAYMTEIHRYWQSLAVALKEIGVKNGEEFLVVRLDGLQDSLYDDEPDN